MCVCVGILISGCASPLPVGGLVTSVKLPVSGNDVRYSKEGHASCVSILSIFAVGDCSVGKAARNGGVVKIKMVDRKAFNFLGLFGKYTTIVQGD